MTLLIIFRCFAKIGKRSGKQDVILGTGCEYKGTILHEIVHLLGFYHEHNRKDRDSYLKIYEDNLDPGRPCSIMLYFFSYCNLQLAKKLLTQ